VEAVWNLPSLWRNPETGETFFEYWPVARVRGGPNVQWVRLATPEEWKRFLAFLKTPDWEIEVWRWPFWFRSQWSHLGYRMESLTEEAERETKQIFEYIRRGRVPGAIVE
jgi:hypothetical protein